MKTLSTHTKEAYKASPQHALDQLLHARRKWQRRATIAANKLEDLQRQLDKLAQENVNALLGKENNETR